MSNKTVKGLFQESTQIKASSNSKSTIIELQNKQTEFPMKGIKRL